MKEKIIEKLQERGYNAEITNVVKNGVTMCGLTFRTTESNIAPTIYIDSYLDCTDGELSGVVDKIIETYKKAVEDTPDVDIDKLMNWEWAKDNLQLCIQRKGNEDIVKRDFLNLEEYVRVRVSEDGTFKVTPRHLNEYGITEETLFKTAWECTLPTIEIEDMAAVMAELMGVSIEETKEMMGDKAMIVATNKSKLHGAIAMKATEKLVEIADRYEKDLAILPSSIHEILLIPVDENTNFETLNRMVQEVNATQVTPEEVLSNHAYRLNREERSITFYHDTKSGKYTF